METVRVAVETVPIRRLIERVLAGEIRIPAFQRGFVWSADQVALLMDSVYRGYPIGALLLWRTREELAKERELGPFELPDVRNEGPIDYVLDGQQRLTSLFGVFQTALQPVRLGDWCDVYLDLRAPEGLENQFVALAAGQADPARHFPLRTIFDSASYRKACLDLTDASDVERLDELQGRFKEAMVPVETVDIPDREQVAIVFERINRAGIPLDAFQLLSAWTYHTDSDLGEAFHKLAAEVEPFGFSQLEGEQSLLMKCCAAVIEEDASLHGIMSLHGPTVRARFEEIESGIHGAIDFLRTELRVYSLETMPFPAMIVPLARFFASTKAAGFTPTDRQRRELARWFWRASFGRRYSGGLARAYAADIRGMAVLREDENARISDFPASVDHKSFLEDHLVVSSVNDSLHAHARASAAAEIGFWNAANPRARAQGRD